MSQDYSSNEPKWLYWALYSLKYMQRACEIADPDCAVVRYPKPFCLSRLSGLWLAPLAGIQCTWCRQKSALDGQL